MFVVESEEDDEIDDVCDRLIDFTLFVKTMSAFKSAQTRLNVFFSQIIPHGSCALKRCQVTGGRHLHAITCRQIGSGPL